MHKSLGRFSCQGVEALNKQAKEKLRRKVKEINIILTDMNFNLSLKTNKRNQCAEVLKSLILDHSVKKHETRTRDYSKRDQLYWKFGRKEEVTKQLRVEVVPKPVRPLESLTLNQLRLEYYKLTHERTTMKDPRRLKQKICDLKVSALRL